MTTILDIPETTERLRAAIKGRKGFGADMVEAYLAGLNASIGDVRKNPYSGEDQFPLAQQWRRGFNEMAAQRIPGLQAMLDDVDENETDEDYDDAL